MNTLKKYQRFFLIPFIALTLAACGADDETTVNEADLKPQQQTIQGVLHETVLGKFVLQPDDGTSVTVASLAINLKPYIGRTIEVTGRQAENGETFEIEDLFVLGSREGTWVDYKNEQMGIFFKYRSFWHMEEYADAVYFTPYFADEGELVDRILFIKKTFDTTTSLREWLKLDENYTPTNKEDVYVYSPSIVGPDQLAAIKRLSPDGESVDFYVIRENFVYTISHINQDRKERDTYRNVYFDMLNTFRFIPFGEGVSTIKTSEDVVEKKAEVTAEPETKSPVTNETKTEEETKEAVTETTEPAPEKTPEPEPAAPEEEAETTAPAASVNESKAGFILLSSRGLHLDVQYPKDWYWQQFGRRIAFNIDEMVSEEDAKVFLEIRSSDSLAAEGLSGLCISWKTGFLCFYGNTKTGGETVASMVTYANAILETAKENDL